MINMLNYREFLSADGRLTLSFGEKSLSDIKGRIPDRIPSFFIFKNKYSLKCDNAQTALLELFK